MPVFKAAIRIILNHPIYLLVYVVWLSIMGIFLASSLYNEDGNAEFAASEVSVAVVDRDGSELSQGLSSFLEKDGQLASVKDDSFAFQDAIATGEVEYLLIIPQDYEKDFLIAAHTGQDAPVMESAFSYASAAGSLADQQVQQYLGLVRAAAILEPELSSAELLAQANSSIKESVSIETLSTSTAATPSDCFAFFLKWGTYTLTAAIVVCVGILMVAYNHVDIRRRNIVAPISSLNSGMQKAAACLLVTLFVWAVSCGMGLVALNPFAQGASVETVVLLLAAALVFSTVPLSIGFLLGQLNVSEMASNAVGNIAGMAMSFLGGAWISLSLLTPEVQALSHFAPTYWYINAVDQITQLSEFTPAALTPIAGNLAVVMLFSVTLFTVALALGRMRMSSAAAGGNAAASTT